jgi:hypothetical protein
VRYACILRLCRSLSNPLSRSLVVSLSRCCFSLSLSHSFSSLSRCCFSFSLSLSLVLSPSLCVSTLFCHILISSQTLYYCSTPRDTSCLTKRIPRRATCRTALGRVRCGDRGILVLRRSVLVVLSEKLARGAERKSFSPACKLFGYYYEYAPSKDKYCLDRNAKAAPPAGVRFPLTGL